MKLLDEHILEERDDNLTYAKKHQRVYKFPNGYGASVIMGGNAYSDIDHPYEVAVIGLDNHLCYTTPITDDVIGYLDADGVNDVLNQIMALPKENL